MSNQYKTVAWETITAFVEDVFRGYGVPKVDAKICADVLLESDRGGIESHGVNRLKPIYIDRIKAGTQNPLTQHEIVRETPTTAVIDGHNGMGQAISYHSMNIAIEKAKKYGMGMVAVRNSNHYGVAGYYAKMAVREGCIGITGTNARPSVAPTFGVENMLGTNPLTFAMPTDEEFPFLLDCATSVIQRGKIEYYNRIGKEVPQGTVVDHEGLPLTDAGTILSALSADQAALVALGGIGESMAGYKGYGYATVVEILSAALQQGQYLKMLTGMQDGQRKPMGLGHFFIAMDTEAFLGLEAFRKTAGDILRALRDSQRASDQQPIYTAGEKEYRIWQQIKDTGVSINASVSIEFQQICKELGLHQYTHLFG